MSRLGIYVLGCDHGCYYIGYSENGLGWKLNEYVTQSKDGAEWLTCHPARKIVAEFPGTAASHLDTVHEYMRLYGIDHVRGHPYTAVTLSIATIHTLAQSLNVPITKCIKCGANGHRFNACPTMAPTPTITIAQKGNMPPPAPIPHLKLTQLAIIASDAPVMETVQPKLQQAVAQTSVFPANVGPWASGLWMAACYKPLRLQR